MEQKTRIYPHPIEVVHPKCVEPEVEPKDGPLTRFAAGVRAEWDFYNPEGPPETYTDGTPMQSMDAMLYGGLTILCWLFYIVIATLIVALVVVAIT